MLTSILLCFIKHCDLWIFDHLSSLDIQTLAKMCSMTINTCNMIPSPCQKLTLNKNALEHSQLYMLLNCRIHIKLREHLNVFSISFGTWMEPRIYWNHSLNRRTRRIPVESFLKFGDMHIFVHALDKTARFVGGERF